MKVNLNTYNSSILLNTKTVTQPKILTFKSIKNIAKKELGEQFRNRANVLPQNINHIMYSTGMLLEESINKPEYVSRFFKYAEPLYKRLAFGTNKEEFANSYRAELDFISKAKKLINETQVGKISDEVFENNIVELSNNYIKTPIQRTKYFAI